MNIELDAQDYKVAIVMIRRATCTGEEAAQVTRTLHKLEHCFQQEAAKAATEWTPEAEEATDNDD